MPLEPLYNEHGNVIGHHNAHLVYAEVQRLKGALVAHHEETRRLYAQYQAVRAALRDLLDVQFDADRSLDRARGRANAVLSESESSSWTP